MYEDFYERMQGYDGCFVDEILLQLYADMY
jgi:hypothetical protein